MIISQIIMPIKVKKTILDYVYMKNLEDTTILDSLNKLFTNKRGAPFNMPKAHKSAILLVSGGFDSILLWGVLMDTFKIHIYPVSATKKWGERKAIEYYSKYYKEHYPRFFHSVAFKQYKWRFGFQNNDKSLQFDMERIIANLNLRELYVKICNFSRLSLFAFIGYEYGLLLNTIGMEKIKTILTGIVPDDAYWSHEDTLTNLRTINLTMSHVLNDFTYQFSGAVEKDAGLYFEKKDLLSFALLKKIPMKHTWSCDLNTKIQCGACNSCIGRRLLFSEAGQKDPTQYMRAISLKARIISLWKRRKISILR